MDYRNLLSVFDYLLFIMTVAWVAWFPAHFYSDKAGLYVLGTVLILFGLVTISGTN